MRVVRSLDRAREERILWCVNGADGRGLERSAPGVTDGQSAVCRCTLFGDMRPKRSIREVEVPGERLQERRVVLLDRVNRTATARPSAMIALETMPY